MRRAARDVNVLDFIESLPHGFDEPVRERGNSLSTGQKQLINFARALAYNPHILILDEATSSVDTDTELRIRGALERMVEGRTSVLIAHRLSTVQRAETILVMHKGQLREMGSHQELLAQLVVVHVEVEREQVDGDGVGEGSFEVLLARLLRIRRIGGDDLAEFVGVERSFALHLVLRLLPDQVGKGLREASVLGEGVRDIDVELEGDREAVIHEAGGDKDTLRIAQRKIAVADSAVAEQHIVAIGDQGLVAVGDGERNKVECFAGEDCGNRLRERRRPCAATRRRKG